MKIVHKHKVQTQNADEWITVSKDFTADSDRLDEFIVGAAQVKGGGRFLMIDCVVIEEM